MDPTQIQGVDTSTTTYYEAHKEARKQFQKQYYEEKKEQIKAYYSQDDIKAKRAAYMREYRKRVVA